MNRQHALRRTVEEEAFDRVGGRAELLLCGIELAEVGADAVAQGREDGEQRHQTEADSGRELRGERFQGAGLRQGLFRADEDGRKQQKRENEAGEQADPDEHAELPHAGDRRQREQQEHRGRGRRARQQGRRDADQTPHGAGRLHGHVDMHAVVDGQTDHEPAGSRHEKQDGFAGNREESDGGERDDRGEDRDRQRAQIAAHAAVIGVIAFKFPDFQPFYLFHGICFYRSKEQFSAADNNIINKVH